MTDNLLKEEGWLPSDKEPIMATVKGVISSEIWLRMKRAEKVLVEVPFSTTGKDGGKPKIVSGTMDLVFKEKDGWVIADYKTYKVDGNLDALIAFHKLQVEMYREFFEHISGKKVKEAGLYFTNPGKWVIVR